MRQFILGGNVAYSAASTPSAVANGAVGFFYNDNGIPKVTATGEEIANGKEAMLVLGRLATAGGPVILPIHSNHFSYVRGNYQAATTFKGTVTVTAPTVAGTYSIIITKKGVKFNERSNFTADVYIPNTTTTATQLAAQLADAINKNTSSSGVTATAAAAVITIDATEKGVDYALTPADRLSGATTSITTAGISAYGDVQYVIDLANKAAADAGFEYTYQDALPTLYPNYPLNPLAQPNANDTGFTIFTLRFAEPRDVKTRDEVVHQIVQVAFPTGAAAIETFETVVSRLSGIIPPVEP